MAFWIFQTSCRRVISRNGESTVEPEPIPPHACVPYGAAVCGSLEWVRQQWVGWPSWLLATGRGGIGVPCQQLLSHRS